MNYLRILIYPEVQSTHASIRQLLNLIKTNGLSKVQLDNTKSVRSLLLQYFGRIFCFIEKHKNKIMKIKNWTKPN